VAATANKISLELQSLLSSGSNKAGNLQRREPMKTLVALTLSLFLCIGTAFADSGKELSPEELRGLEVKLKKVGKRAAALMEES
jgi:hypothetical protein